MSCVVDVVARSMVPRSWCKVGYLCTMVGRRHSAGLAPGSKVGAGVQGRRRGPRLAPGSNVGAEVQCRRRGPMSAPRSNVGARPGMHTVLAEILF